MEKWDNLEDCQKRIDQNFDDFISEFEVKYQEMETTGAAISADLLTFILMRKLGLNKTEKKDIISQLETKKRENLFEDVKVKVSTLFKGRDLDFY